MENENMKKNMEFMINAGKIMGVSNNIIKDNINNVQVKDCDDSSYIF